MHQFEVARTEVVLASWEERGQGEQGAGGGEGRDCVTLVTSW